MILATSRLLSRHKSSFITTLPQRSFVFAILSYFLTTHSFIGRSFESDDQMKFISSPRIQLTLQLQDIEDLVDLKKTLAAYL